MQRSLKRKLVFGLAALAVVAFAGGAYAATQSSAPNTRQAFLNDVAKRLGVTPQQLTAALNGATQDQLQAAVKSGRLTQAQANALAQGLKQNWRSVHRGPDTPSPASPRSQTLTWRSRPAEISRCPSGVKVTLRIGSV